MLKAAAAAGKCVQVIRTVTAKVPNNELKEVKMLRGAAEFGGNFLSF